MQLVTEAAAGLHMCRRCARAEAGLSGVLMLHHLLALIRKVLGLRSDAGLEDWAVGGKFVHSGEMILSCTRSFLF